MKNVHALACLALLVGSAPAVATPIADAFGALAATPPQQAVGSTIAVICPSGKITSADLQARCNEIAGQALAAMPSDAAGARDGLQAMAPEEDAVLGSLQVDADQNHLDTVRGRLSALRGAGAPLASLSLSLDGTVLAGLGTAPTRGQAAGAADGKVGLFFSGSFSSGDRDATARESGFDFDAFDILGGADYEIAPGTVVGAALGYATNSADIDANGGDVDSDAVSIIGYASFSPSPSSYVDATVSYTRGSFDQNRAVRYAVGTTTVNQTAISDTDSTDFAVSVQGGYDWFADRVTYGVYGRLEYARTDIDGFTERMSNTTAAGNGLALIIDNQDFTSIPASIGAHLTRSYRIGDSTVFPQIYGHFTHEFANDNDPVVARFVADPTNTRFFLPTDKPDRNYFTLGLQVSTAFGDDGSASLRYEALLGHSELSTHTIGVGLKLRF